MASNWCPERSHGREVDEEVNQEKRPGGVWLLGTGMERGKGSGALASGWAAWVSLGYSHWALYVGDGYVIHLAPPDEYPGAGSSSLFSVLSSRGKVKRELLSDVVGGCHYRVNNHLDHEYSPLPVNKIISSAEEMVGKELAYSVLSRNCEHFVTDLRYGKARSPQAEKFVTGASVTLGAAVVAALACSVMKKRSQHQ
ncbi:phospholipase A and acyltransferase 4-like [Myotis daubentonii]|uniref:phospholipase A and acyltransferase 4-like n=1 Tax=Myotis daubentonii TaxID=98922 RepID=UPI002873E64B|nr:phospholipase A and acyltransferase 4-like [Myotis daubentonii]